VEAIKKHNYSIDQLKDWHDEGWTFRVRVSSARAPSMIRRKGQNVRRMGPPTDELLKKISEIQKEDAESSTMDITKTQLNHLEQRSLENMIYFYRHELHQITRGENTYKILPNNIRKMMTEAGIITKHIRSYRLTQLGERMLKREDER